MAGMPEPQRRHVTISQYMAPLKRRPEITALHEGLIDLELRTEWIVEHHTVLRKAYEQRSAAKCSPVFPAPFNYHELPPDEPDPDERSRLLVRRLNALKGKPYEHMLKMWWQHRDQLAWAIRDWRDSLHLVRELLPTVAKHMDDPEIIASKVWTARVRRLLGELGGCLPAMQGLGQLPPIDDAKFDAELTVCLDRLRPLTDELKMVGPEPEATLGRKDQIMTTPSRERFADFDRILYERCSEELEEIGARLKQVAGPLARIRGDAPMPNLDSPPVVAWFDSQVAFVYREALEAGGVLRQGDDTSANILHATERVLFAWRVRLKYGIRDDDLRELVGSIDSLLNPILGEAARLAARLGVDRRSLFCAIVLTRPPSTEQRPARFSCRSRRPRKTGRAVLGCARPRRT
jgi:hypothetical protein